MESAPAQGAPPIMSQQGSFLSANEEDVAIIREVLAVQHVPVITTLHWEKLQTILRSLCDRLATQALPLPCSLLPLVKKHCSPHAIVVSCEETIQREAIVSKFFWNCVFVPAWKLSIMCFKGSTVASGLWIEFHVFLQIIVV